MDSLEFPQATSLNVELFSYFTDLSDNVLETLLTYAKVPEDIHPREVLRTLKTCAELNLYLPLSGLLFPTRDLRAKYFYNPSCIEMQEFNNSRRNKLQKLCSYTTSIALLEALKHHLITCQSSKDVEEFTPCPPIYVTACAVTTNPKTLDMPRRTNIKLVWQNILSSLICYVHTYPSPMFHDSQSVPQLDNLEVTTSYVIPNLRSNLSKFRLKDTIPRDTFTVFFPKTEAILEQIEVPLSDPPLASYTHRALEETGLWNLTSTQFTRPESNEYDTIDTDVRLVIFDLLSDDITETIPIPEASFPTLASTKLRFIYSLLHEAQQFHNWLTNTDGQSILGYNNSLVKLCSAIYTFVRDEITMMMFYGKPLTKNEFQTMCSVLCSLSKNYFTQDETTQPVKLLRHRSCFILPRGIASPELYKMLLALHHLATFFKERNLVSIYSPIPMGYEDNLLAFYHDFPDLGVHSLRLLHYFQTFPDEMPLEAPPTIRRLQQLANRHEKCQENWFTAKIRALAITINLEPLTTLYSSFDTREEFLTLKPKNMHSGERQTLKRLKYPPRTWKIIPRMNWNRNSRFRRTYDDSEEYKNYPEYYFR